jgi:hypothetical protein
VLLAPSAVPVMAQWMISRAVYSCITALEVNLLNCRIPRVRRRSSGHRRSWRCSTVEHRRIYGT